MPANEKPDGAPRLNRRRLLQVGGAAGLSVLVGKVVSERDRPSSTPNPPATSPTGAGGTSRTARTVSGDGSPAAWSNPATWDGQVPGRTDVAVITGPVRLDVDVQVAGVTIEGAGQLIFEPAVARTLESTGNVVVLGRLDIQPESADVTHRLVFRDVDETGFKGGGSDVLEPDVGLWVMGEGALDTAGSPKLAWARAAGAIGQGATTIELQVDPTGWRVGDEIAITPTGSPEDESHWEAYDVLTVAALQGRSLTLAGPTSVEHPAVTVDDGVVSTPE
ncbi:MAG: hypothetical protein ACR2G7_05010, partial [Acidimicrobiales bacterium]